MKRTFVVLALLGLAVVPAAAAHVEPSPEKVPANSVSRITLSAEGEESVPAVRLTIQIPAGVTNVVPRAGGGWKPSTHGRIITWSGGQIPNGDEGKFQFSARFPNTPGKVLVFPALVTYANGKVVHWIGAESSDTPAPRITLVAGPKTTTTTTTTATTTTIATGDTVNNDNSDSNNWIWLVVAAVALVAIAAALLLRRRRTP